MHLQDYAQLSLAPGTYTLCSVRASRGADITVTGGSQTVVNVQNDFRIQNAAKFVPAPGTPTPMVNVDGLTVRIGATGFVQAFLSAPSAQFRMGRHSTFAGTMCSASIGSDKGITMMCPPTP